MRTVSPALSDSHGTEEMDVNGCPWPTEYSLAERGHIADKKTNSVAEIFFIAMDVP